MDAFAPYMLMAFIVFSRTSMADGERPSLGAIVDLSSRIGTEVVLAMMIAMEDHFPDVKQRPFLHVKDSRGNFDNASAAARSLAEIQQVVAIIWLMARKEANKVCDIGIKYEIPILSLADPKPSHSQFLLHMERSQHVEMKLIASIVQNRSWRRVNVIYDASNPKMISLLEESLKDGGVLVSQKSFVSSTYSTKNIIEKLKHLKRGDCKVFVIHTSPHNAAKIFVQARKLEMMVTGYAWLVTSSTGDAMEDFNDEVKSSMEGVLGVMTYVRRDGRRYDDFVKKFEPLSRSKYPSKTSLEAYDAVRVVANQMRRKKNRGQSLLRYITQSDFTGLSGQIKFDGGKLPPARNFRLVNVVGMRCVEIGLWANGLGFTRKFDHDFEFGTLSSLKPIIWPGNPPLAPSGWVIPSTNTHLKIGIPIGNIHKEFILFDNITKTVSGFAIDVFNATLKNLPYELTCEFMPFEGTYDDLVKQISLRTVDAVVGDVAIIAHRCDYAEFSQPYTETGLQMLVYAPNKRTSRFWITLKPFTPKLWSLILLVTAYNGMVFWYLDQRDETAPPQPLRNVIFSAFITLFTLKAQKQKNTWTLMIMVPWLCFSLVITQSYTACLSSLLTLEGYPDEIPTVEALKKEGAKVGCDHKSFIPGYLENVLGFSKENIVELKSEEEYRVFLMEKRVAAVFVQLAHLRFFLATNCDGFMGVGPVYQVGGFGFVFPKLSPHLPEISKAFLKLAESRKNVSARLTSKSRCKRLPPGGGDEGGLSPISFLGLIILTIASTTIAFLCFTVQPLLKHIRRLRRPSLTLKIY